MELPGYDDWKTNSPISNSKDDPDIESCSCDVSPEDGCLILDFWCEVHGDYDDQQSELEDEAQRQKYEIYREEGLY